MVWTQVLVLGQHPWPGNTFGLHQQWNAVFGLALVPAGTNCLHTQLVKLVKIVLQLIGCDETQILFRFDKMKILIDCLCVDTYKARCKRIKSEKAMIMKDGYTVV